jgi:hypothetical protein
MPRPRFELWGESLREIGVLILVFVPLDVFVETMKGAAQTESHWVAVGMFALFGIVLIVLGVEIETR